MEFLIPLTLVGLAGLAYKFTSHHKVKKWISHKKKTVATLRNFVKTLSDNKINVEINDTGKSATVLFSRLGKQYLVFLPYDSSKFVSMLHFKAELLREGKPSLLVTQYPGVPYSVSAKDLGGNALKITNQETGESHTFKENEIPGFAEMLFE